MGLEISVYLLRIIRIYMEELNDFMKLLLKLLETIVWDYLCLEEKI